MKPTSHPTQSRQRKSKIATASVATLWDAVLVHCCASNGIVEQELTLLCSKKSGSSIPGDMTTSLAHAVVRGQHLPACVAERPACIVEQPASQVQGSVSSSIDRRVRRRRPAKRAEVAFLQFFGMHTLLETPLSGSDLIEVDNLLH
jgi:hypothetical protein